MTKTMPNGAPALPEGTHYGKHWTHLGVRWSPIVHAAGRQVVGYDIHTDRMRSYEGRMTKVAKDRWTVDGVEGEATNPAGAILMMPFLADDVPHHEDARAYAQEN